jgi:DNA-directed RNA polymerase subunit H
LVEEKTISILKHRLVPEHVILTEDEIKEICEKYNIRKQQLPKIFTTDAVVKEMGAKIGDVFKILRSSPTAGNIDYYRIVIKKVINRGVKN